MSFLRDPFDWKDPDVARSTESYVPFKSERRSTRHLAYGSFACPCCDVPLALGRSINLDRELMCAFCEAIHPVRAFVRLEHPDTSLNAVELRARLPL